VVSVRKGRARGASGGKKRSLAESRERYFLEEGGGDAEKKLETILGKKSDILCGSIK